MEESKYYTPEIEEFHVGFEFEYLHIEGKLIGQISNIKEWRKDICDCQWLNRICDEYEHSLENIKDLYRVKYLDKEDIESLGWEHQETKRFEDHKVDTFIQDKYKLTFEQPSRMICILEELDNYTVKYLFIGIIKNKSELMKQLKKLMKQLNIEL